MAAKVFRVYKGKMRRYDWKRKNKSKVDYALKQIKLLKKDQEWKFLDTNLSDTSLARAGFITQINDVQSGTTNNTMVGEKCTIRQLNLNMEFKALETGNNAPYGFIRVIVFRVPERQLDATTPLVTDILAASATNQHYLNASSRNYKFKVLYDRVKALSGYSVDVDAAGGVVALGTGLTRFSIRHKFKKGAVLEADGTVSYGRIFVLCIHNYPDEFIDLAARARVYFTDS